VFGDRPEFPNGSSLDHKSNDTSFLLTLKGKDHCWAGITFLRYPSNKDVHLSFLCQMRMLYMYYFLKCRYPGWISDFHILNLIRISMFSDICQLFSS